MTLFADCSFAGLGCFGRAGTDLTSVLSPRSSPGCGSLLRQPVQPPGWKGGTSTIDLSTHLDIDPTDSSMTIRFAWTLQRSRRNPSRMMGLPACVTLGSPPLPTLPVVEYREAEYSLKTCEIRALRACWGFFCLDSGTGLPVPHEVLPRYCTVRLEEDLAQPLAYWRCVFGCSYARIPFLCRSGSEHRSCGGSAAAAADFERPTKIGRTSIAGHGLGPQLQALRL